MNTNQNLWSEPRRMRLSSLLVLYVRELVTSLKTWPFFFYVLLSYVDKELSIWQKLGYAIVFFLVFSLIQALYKYFTTKYFIADEKVQIRISGLKRTELYLPLKKVYQLRSSQSLLLQMVDMEVIQFESLGSKKVEVELVLPQEEVRAMKDYAASFQSTVSNSDVEETEETNFEQPENERERNLPFGSFSYEISRKELLISSLTRNPLRGLILAVGAVGTVFNEISDYLVDYIRIWSDQIELWFFNITLVVGVIIFLGVFVLSFLIQSLFLIFKQYDLKISIKEGQLKYSAGLINKIFQSSTCDRIVSCTFQQNLIEQWLGLGSIHIHFASAMVSATEKKGDKNSDIKIYGINKKRVAIPLIESIYPDYKSSRGQSYKSTSAYFRRLLFFSLIATLLSAVVAYFLSHIIWYFVPLVALGGLFYSYLSYRQSWFSFEHSYLLIGHGAFTIKRTILPVNQIETMVLWQRWRQKSGTTANMKFATRGTFHQIAYIDKNVLNDLRDHTLCVLEFPRYASSGSGKEE
ncbi:MAG: PH domain-containing protein [Porphyromonas sp.]|nr:PH domain-containing protein [Porphyromonas sp.]